MENLPNKLRSVLTKYHMTTDKIERAMLMSDISYIIAMAKLEGVKANRVQWSPFPQGRWFKW